MLVAIGNVTAPSQKHTTGDAVYTTLFSYVLFLGEDPIHFRRIQSRQKSLSRDSCFPSENDRACRDGVEILPRGVAPTHKWDLAPRVLPWPNDHG